MGRMQSARTLIRNVFFRKNQKKQKPVKTTDIILDELKHIEEYKRTFIVENATKEVYIYSLLVDTQAILSSMGIGVDIIVRDNHAYVPLSWVMFYLSRSANEENQNFLKQLKKMQENVLECYEKRLRN